MTDPSLPAPELLLCAFRGHLDYDGEIVDWAHQLADLHRQLIATPANSTRIRIQITTLTERLDAFLLTRLPRPLSGTPLHTDSLGNVISRLAEAWECAHWLLMHYPPEDPRVHRAWEHLAELRDAYLDLAHAAEHGRITLPRFWPGLEALCRA